MKWLYFKYLYHGRSEVLRIDINDKNKVVALWFTNQENPQENLPQNIEKEIEEYKQKKYRICMYQSGNGDVKINLLNLILNNAN